MIFFAHFFEEGDSNGTEAKWIFRIYCMFYCHFCRIRLNFLLMFAAHC